MAGGVFFEEKVTLKSVRERFEQWRKQRERLGPIPADLWAAAAELTKRHTYLEVSKALRVNYNDLKKRARAMQENRVQGEPSHNGFVEVDLVGMGNCAGAEFDLQWEGLCGERLRIQVRGKSEVDVAGVVRALGEWGR